ncbi:MAG: hypothetical protein HFJ84_11200 [Clostridiales bacterium]|jgi:hypothetical protein|nr:hypothetical protein [Clostridiales bacterium]
MSKIDRIIQSAKDIYYRTIFQKLDHYRGLAKDFYYRTYGWKKIPQDERFHILPVEKFGGYVIWDNLKKEHYPNSQHFITLEHAQNFLEIEMEKENKYIEWENISNLSQNPSSPDQPQTNVDSPKDQEQTHDQTKTVVALESSEDVSDPKKAAEWENISNLSQNPPSPDQPQTNVDSPKDQEQTSAQTKTIVALESSEDVSDPENHFTHQYSDGRQCVKYRLVKIGQDGNLKPYAKDKIFISTDMAEEFICDHTSQLTVVSYDDLVHQAEKEKFGYPKDAGSFSQNQPSPSTKKKSYDLER